MTLKDAAGVAITHELWAAEGTNLTAEATANAGWLFAGWRTVDANVSFASGKKEDYIHSDAFATNASTCERISLIVHAPVLLRAEFVGNAYAVRFDTTGGTGSTDRRIFTYGKVYTLPSCTAASPAGKKRFVGWACSNGRRYDDGVLVFNLAKPGETVTMTAIWE